MRQDEKSECHQNMLMNEDTALPIKSFSDWFSVLKNDDVTGYDNIMDAADEQKRHKFVNGYFEYDTTVKSKVKGQAGRYGGEFCRPVILAVGFASRRVFKKLIKNGGHVEDVEIDGQNCIHALISATAHDRQREDQLLEMFREIRSIVPLETFRLLIHAECATHMRPIELAVKIGAFGIFREIMEATGIYEQPAGDVGLNRFATYDFDVYENNKDWRREIRSPLRLLRFMEIDHVPSFLKYDIIHMPVIQAWASWKKRQAFPVIVLWFFLRTVFLFFAIMMDPHSFEVYYKLGGCEAKVNGSWPHWACYYRTANDPNIGLVAMMYFTSFAMLLSLIFALFDLAELIVRMVDKETRILDRILQRSGYVAYTRFYRACQIVLCVSGVTGGITLLLVGDHKRPRSLHYLKAINMPFILMGLLYIMEPAPILGNFAITLQRMITAMLKFLLLQLIIEMTFTLFFMSANTGIKGFETLDEGIYTLFLLDQNVIDFGLTPPWYVRLSHFSHFVITNILLINYLIAVMSSLICENKDERKAIILIRVLDVCYLADDRVVRWFRKLWRRYRPVEPFLITVCK